MVCIKVKCTVSKMGGKSATSKSGNDYGRLVCIVKDDSDLGGAVVELFVPPKVADKARAGDTFEAMMKLDKINVDIVEGSYRAIGEE